MIQPSASLLHLMVGIVFLQFYVSIIANVQFHIFLATRLQAIRSFVECCKCTLIDLHQSTIFK